MMNDLDLDALLNDSAPPVRHSATCEACRAATRSARVKRGRRHVVAVVVAAGVTVGVGGVAAATGATSLASHLGWVGDNAVSTTSSEGIKCHLSFRAVPEEGVVGQARTPDEAPEVREAQAHLRGLDLDTYVVPDEEVRALKQDYERNLGSAEVAAHYTDAFFENQALFASLVDDVRQDLATKGMAFDNVVTLEGADECTKRLFEPITP